MGRPVALSRRPDIRLWYRIIGWGQFDNLRAILVQARVRYRNEWQLAATILYGQAVLDSDRVVPAGLPNTLIPLSDRLAADLCPLLSAVVPDTVAFDRLFDRFECLLGLVYSDVMKVGWAPTGRFVYEQYGTGVDKVSRRKSPRLAPPGRRWRQDCSAGQRIASMRPWKDGETLSRPTSGSEASPLR